MASGKGGVGKSTLTANLGITLSQFGKDVTILDADVDMANLSLLMNLETTPKTLHDYLCGKAAPEEIIFNSYGVNIVPSGLTLDSLLKVDVERLSEIIQILKNTDFLLVDSPAGLGRAVIQAIASCDATIIITNPEVSSVSDALKIMMISRKLGSNVLGTVVNKVPRRVPDNSCVIPEDIAAVLECTLIGTVPDETNLVRRSINSGVPFVISHPYADVSKAVKKIAASLAGIEIQNSEESTLRRFFRKIFRR